MFGPGAARYLLDMTQPDPGPILVTGCSSGVGEATAALLARRGCTVYATARKPESLTDLAALGCRTLALDVTDEASMAEAVATVEREHGAVGVLVNNAGFGVYSTVEEVDLAQLRAVFETNVFGAIRMVQLVLPGMRRAGTGRIVTVSSVAAHVSVPLLSAYTATKHALTALTDALRVETAALGVTCVVIEPSAVRSRFTDNAPGLSKESTRSSPYHVPSPSRRRLLTGLFQAPMFAARPETVARSVGRAVLAPSPKARYRPTVGAHAVVAAYRVTPRRLWDAGLRAGTGL
jgi:NAD(P)-dependent dehydrogenase (short-subunit alcohol dehydrogenase family)